MGNCISEGSVDRGFNRASALLEKNEVLAATEQFEDILSSLPLHTLVVGTAPNGSSNTLSATSSFTSGSSHKGRHRNPLGVGPASPPANSSSSNNNGSTPTSNGAGPSSSVPPTLPAWSVPAASGEQNQPSSNHDATSAASSGSAIFPKIPPTQFHDALATLKLRLRIGDMYYKYDHYVQAEEQYLICQSGGNALRNSSTNAAQEVLSTDVWVLATFGVCKVTLADARTVEHHSASTHDRLCGYCLSQIAVMRPVITSVNGVGSEEMAVMLKLEAEANAERRNFRTALMCAQKASGITAGRFGVTSDERKEIQKLIVGYKEVLADRSSGNVSEAEEREDVSY